MSGLDLSEAKDFIDKANLNHIVWCIVHSYILELCLDGDIETIEILNDYFDEIFKEECQKYGIICNQRNVDALKLSIRTARSQLTLKPNDLQILKWKVMHLDDRLSVNSAKYFDRYKMLDNVLITATDQFNALLDESKEYHDINLSKLLISLSSHIENNRNFLKHTTY